MTKDQVEPAVAVETRSPEETSRLAGTIAERVRSGGVVWLHGPLGAGKTLLAKAVFAAFGVDPAEVTSPTFTFINPYRGASALPLYHIDLYRTETEADLETIGIEEAIDSGGVVLIEWAEKLGESWGRPDLVVRIEDLGEDRRRIRIARG
jgi:tRNA threonylcarbamoyladenosine biosynthesis protein TsaE